MFSGSFITDGFLAVLLADCVDLLFLHVLLFRSCRSDKLPLCGFKSSFSRIILCFDLRNIVGTLFSTATCTSIGNFLWQMPSQASRSLLQLQDIAYIRSDYVQKPGSNSYEYCSLWLRSWIALIPVRTARCTSLWFIERGILHLNRASCSLWLIQRGMLHLKCARFGIWPRAIMGQRGNLRALAGICEFH